MIGEALQKTRPGLLVVCRHLVRKSSTDEMGLVNGVTGFFSIIYVPSRLIVSGNAAATANNILASERLFRLGMVSELTCAAEFVFLL
jgi:hypothetical protein